MNDGGKGENHSIRGLLPVSYNLFIRKNINYKSLNIGYQYLSLIKRVNENSANLVVRRNLCTFAWLVISCALHSGRLSIFE